MTPAGLTDLESRRAYLRRLSVVFAVELRLKIVTELYMRPMSPTRFYDEFGGGSLSRVTRNFERLDETGWLEYVRSEGPGGRRRGGVEGFYRATELAYFDAETWALLPYSIRVAFSWNSFKQIASRLRVAIETGRVDASSDRSLSHTSVYLDRTGWGNTMEAIRAHFAFLSEEQKQSTERLARSGDDPVRGSVIQIAFEPPLDGGGPVAPSLVESPKEPFVPLPVRLSKVLADDVCMRIVKEANGYAVSAKQFHEEIGGDTAAGIRRRFTKLGEIALLTEVEAKTGGKRRGAREKFYRATGPAIFDDRSGPWTGFPRSQAETVVWKRFEELSVEVKSAMKAGTFDARDDSCLAWSLLRLDVEGWRAVLASLEELRLFIASEQDRAEARMTQSGERPVTMTIGLAAFESAPGAEREP